MNLLQIWDIAGQTEALHDQCFWFNEERGRRGEGCPTGQNRGLVNAVW